MDEFPPLDVIQRLRAIEHDLLFAKGPKRTYADVRIAAIQCIYWLSEACKDRLAAEDPAPMRLMRDAVSIRPAPLQFLLHHLLEVHNGRPSPLLNHAPDHLGEDHCSMLRTQQKAEAVATLECLKESGMTVPETAKAIAAALNVNSFRNPADRGKGYSWETVRDWRKEWLRKKNGKSTPPFFQKAYNEAFKCSRDRRSLLKKAFGAEFTEQKYQGVELGALKLRLYCTAIQP
jgi:hypothetical protein